MSTLLSNADCGPVNPLSQLSKHTDRDRSLQYDRLVGPSSSRLQRLPPSSAIPGPSQQALDAAAQFFAGPTAVPSQARTAPPSFRPDAWMQEFGTKPTAYGKSAVHFDEKFEASLARAQNQSPSQFQSQPHSTPSSVLWAAEFSNTLQSSPLSTFSRFQPPPQHQQAYITEIPDSAWDEQFAHFARPDAKGKGRAGPEEEAALEEAFARASLQAEGNPNPHASEDVTQPDYMAEFEDVWKQIRGNAEADATSESQWADWEGQLNAIRNGNGEEDYPLTFDNAEFEQRYNEAAAREESKLRYDDDGMPDLGEYEFESNNPYLMHPTPSALPSLLSQSLASPEPSALTRSALILEAMLQRGQGGTDEVGTWYALGQVLCRDEREEKGIKALSRAVQESKGEGEGRAAMLELAIAYVNESRDIASFLTLLRFLRLSFPSQPGLPDPAALRGQALWAVRDAVTDAYLSLARSQHARGEVDRDVQIGLGVLLYSGADFDKAADCFKAALGVNPENAVLWNRLGSCLSNGNRAEESIGAYQRALEIWPNYTRAVFNVGVACLNMGAHREASEHFLSAIAMHDVRSSDQSDHIWTTLRRAFNAMGRHDLADRAMATDRSAEEFRKEGFEF